MPGQAQENLPRGWKFFYPRPDCRFDGPVKSARSIERNILTEQRTYVYIGMISAKWVKSMPLTARSRLDYELTALQVSVALITCQLLSAKAGFRRDQSRGSDGRWDGGSGSVVVIRKDNTGNPRIDRKTDMLVDIVKEVVEGLGNGSGAAYGTAVHSASAATIRALDLPGIGKHGVEQSFSVGGLVRYGLDGSVRTDIVLRDGRTAAAPILAVWDIKTGNARLDQKRVDELRAHLGIDSTVPIIEIHVRRGISVKNISDLLIN